MPTSTMTAQEFVRQWVTAFRDHEGLSLREAEHDSGIPFTTIARIERGEGNVTLSTLMDIARWTGEADDLFGTLAEISRYD